MRFLAGLRLVLAAAALIGLMAGRSIVFPVAAHAAMTVTADTRHDCCAATSKAPAEKADLAGNCLAPGCAMTAPALLPAAPILTSASERSADAPMAAAGLEGRSPQPLIEPPRA